MPVARHEIRELIACLELSDDEARKRLARCEADDKDDDANAKALKKLTEAEAAKRTVHGYVTRTLIKLNGRVWRYLDLAKLDLPDINLATERRLMRQWVDVLELSKKDAEEEFTSWDEFLLNNDVDSIVDAFLGEGPCP